MILSPSFKLIISPTDVFPTLALISPFIPTTREYILFKFVGYDAPEKSRFLSGSVMYIPRNKAPRLKKGEYYIADLIGLNLVYDSKTLGTVEYLSDGAQGLYLNVRDINGNLKIIPNIPQFVSKPDFEKKEITLLIKELMD